MKTTGPDLLLISPAPVFRAVPLGIRSIAAYVRAQGFGVEILVDNKWPRSLQWFAADRDWNFRKEIEKILRGDLTLTEYSLPAKMKNAWHKFTRRVATAIRDPKMIGYYFSRRY